MSTRASVAGQARISTRANFRQLLHPRATTGGRYGDFYHPLAMSSCAPGEKIQQKNPQHRDKRGKEGTRVS